MSGDLTLSVRLTADGKGLVEVVGQGSDAFDKFGKEATQAGKSSTKVGGDFKTLGNESKSLSSHLFSLKNLMGAVASVMLSNQALRMADDYKLLQGRIKLATESTGDYVAVSEKLYSITQSNGAALEGSVGLFQSLARAAPELQATNNEVLTLTKLIQQTGVVSGASTQAMSAGMLQFGQAMAGGVLRAEEFNSLLDNMPELTNQIATGMGLTSGQLRLAVNDGKILSEDVFRVLLGQADEIDAKFQAMPLGLERAGTTLETAMGQMFSRIDNGVGATGALASGLESVAKWMDSISASDFNETLHVTAVAVTAVSTAVGTYYVASWVTATAAQFRANVAMVQAASVSTGMSAALGVQTRMTAAQAASNVVLATTSRAAGIAMATLGGPVGIAIMAALAIGTYVAATWDATKGNDELTASTDKLAGSMDGIAKVGISKQIDVTKTKIEDVNVVIRGLESNIARMRARTDAGASVGIAFNQDAIEKEKVKILELDQKLQGLEETKARISGLSDPKAKKGPVDKADKAAEEYGKQMFDLARQAYPEATQSAEEYGIAEAAVAKSWLASQESADAYGKRMFELARTAYPEATQSAEEYGQQQASLAKQMLDNQTQLRESLYSETEALAANYQRRAEMIALNITDEETRISMLLALEQQYLATSSQSAVTWSDAWSSAGNRFAAGIGDATASALLEQKNFGDAMNALARGAIHSVISGLVEIGVKKIAMSALSSALLAKETVVSSTAAATTAAAWAPAAAATSIASFGSAAAIGGAALLATYVLSKSLFGGSGKGGASPAQTASVGATTPQNLGLPANQDMRPAQKIDIHVYGSMTDLSGLARDLRPYNIELLKRDVI